MRCVQAKNISGEQVLSAYHDCRGKWGVPEWATTWDLQDHLNTYPAKVVLAKLRAMDRRKVLLGCACGCRGDWELPKE